ncbi:phage holin family protein [Paenibacillus rhizophilus]|uniref:Holin n=1 Tax=Paenibacillus rhizophilus TaxID=1850366 RepID=A0A3N9P891_9BACL|nr:phage holin family protein [Paenibacillus rhizophilus]RQW11855.1 holin [Paenibacillus rhizophilus]
MFNQIRQITTTIYTAAVGSGSREIAAGGTSAMAGVLAMATGWLGGWDKPLELLVVLMFADYVSGVAGAFKTHTVSSDIMFWGGVRKAVVLFVVGLSALVDAWVQTGAPVFRAAAIFFYAGREALSVVENFGVLGVPLPDKLKDYLLQLNQDKARNNPAKPGHPDNDKTA